MTDEEIRTIEMVEEAFLRVSIETQLERYRMEGVSNVESANMLRVFILQELKNRLVDVMKEEKLWEHSAKRTST
jgi:hypothetical protein